MLPEPHIMALVWAKTITTNFYCIYQLKCRNRRVVASYHYENGITLWRNRFFKHCLLNYNVSFAGDRFLPTFRLSTFVAWMTYDTSVAFSHNRHGKQLMNYITCSRRQRWRMTCHVERRKIIVRITWSDLEFMLRLKETFLQPDDFIRKDCYV